MPEHSGQKRNFFLLDLPELEILVASSGFQKYRAKQIFDCVYKSKIFSPQSMPNLPLQVRSWLGENFSFSTAELEGELSDKDKTGKYLFKLSDGNRVECVLLEAPSDDDTKMRKTLCISTQVGCACACKFCASAMRGFIRNLDAAEIISQALPFAVKNGNFEFENIVVMGMGEPLLNLENLLKALKVFNSPDKFGFGARRITVSTCGIADKLELLTKENFPYRLAISLHGTSDEVRSQIMPINKKFNIERLLGAAEKFSKTSGRMITLEYIMIDGLNDGPAQAEELAKIARRLHAHINLIPYNPVDGLEWKRSEKSKRLAFAKILERARVSFTLRKEKGSGIDAACGQLALKSPLPS